MSSVLLIVFQKRNIVMTSSCSSQVVSTCETQKEAEIDQILHFSYTIRKPKVSFFMDTLACISSWIKSKFYYFPLVYLACHRSEGVHERLPKKVWTNSSEVFSCRVWELPPAEPCHCTDPTVVKVREARLSSLHQSSRRRPLVPDWSSPSEPRVPCLFLLTSFILSLLGGNWCPRPRRPSVYIGSRKRHDRVAAAC